MIVYMRLKGHVDMNGALAVNAEGVDRAIEEMVFIDGALTLKLLGARRSPVRVRHDLEQHLHWSEIDPRLVDLDVGVVHPRLIVVRGRPPCAEARVRGTHGKAEGGTTTPLH